jgi:hypothetical protein
VISRLFKGSVVMKSSRWFVVVYLSLMVALTGLSLWAGTQNAIVIGFVLDQTGAPVPDATVRLLNVGTGFSRTQTTDDYGSYTFTNVPPAPYYTLIVEKSGFATGIRSNVSVAVGDSKQVVPAFFLQPSAQPGQEVREEEAEARTIAPELVNNTMGGVIDSRTLRTLPLPNRDFLDLALLIPGAYPVEQGSALEGASLVVNGVRADMNNFLLDGTDNNDYTVNQSLPFQLVEALQEFRVQTSTSNPEFGRNAGAQINSVTRSGSNEWHGTVFWFNRVDALSASNTLSAHRGGTFDAYAQAARVNDLNPSAFASRCLDLSTFTFVSCFPTPVLDDPTLSSLFQGGRNPGFVLNQFGANVGGPIVSDKAFFFFNWESFRADNDRPVFERVPDNDSRSIPAFNPSIARVGEILNLFPAPNVPTSTVTDALGFPVSDPDDDGVLDFQDSAFFVGDASNSTETDNLLGRLDIQPTDSINMSFKYNIQIIDQVQAGPVPLTSNYSGSGTNLDGRNQNFSFNYLHQLSDRWVNELRLGWNRFRLDTLPQDAALRPLGLFDNLNFIRKGFPTILIGGADFSFGSYARLGADFTAPSDRTDSVWSAADNLTLVWGRHVLKAGGEYRYNRLDVTNEALARGLVTFFTVPFGAFTGEPDLASIARVSPQFGGGFDRRFTGHSLNWFVQDTWKARQNVTFSYGIRHEINTAPVEDRDRLVNNYPEACPQFICLIRAGDNAIFDADGSSLGTASFRAPRAGFDTDWNNIGPHVGLAWDPWSNGKTVMRAAYRIMFDQQALQPSVNMLHNPPFVQQWASFFPFFELADVFPAGFPDDAALDFDANLDGTLDTRFEGNSVWFRQPYSVVARDAETRTSYVQQFNFNLQQQVGDSSLFEIGYVGSLGTKLPRSRLFLECTPEDLADFFRSLECMPLGVDFQLFGQLLGLGGTNTDSVVTQENTANSNYHALQLGWETRDLQGLTLRLHYEWAHSIDGGTSGQAPVFFFSPAAASLLSNFFGINADQFAALNAVSPTLSLRPTFPVITTRPLLPNDSQNSPVLDERASSDFDIRHRIVIHYIYSVPRFASVIGEGWQLAGITTWRTGQPFTPFVDFFGVPLRPSFRRDPSLDFNNPDGAIDRGTIMGSSDSSFGTSGAIQALPGDTPRSAFEGSGFFNFDFSILKDTYLGAGERVNLQFRVEFFNIFNNVNYRQPFSNGGIVEVTPFATFDPFLPNPFYGQILQAHKPREIQFGLKLIF